MHVRVRGARCEVRGAYTLLGCVDGVMLLFLGILMPGVRERLVDTTISRTRCEYLLYFEFSVSAGDDVFSFVAAFMNTCIGGWWFLVLGVLLGDGWTWSSMRSARCDVRGACVSAVNAMVILYRCLCSFGEYCD